MGKHKHRWVYAMYKGDDFLAQGTKEEICEQMGIKVATFNYYRTTHWKKRCKKNGNHRIIIRVDIT